ncbi:MAG: hypothetical protein QM673_16970 [Gordonia sp. (in: high G+C Gram-positive bacteria)]
MEITVRFTNVYDGGEHVHDETLVVPAPAAEDFDNEFEEWSDDNLFPHTGDGNATDRDATYYADVLACASCPDLQGREFTWGI